MCVWGGGVYTTIYSTFSPCLKIHTISQWVAAQIPSLPHRGYEEAYKVWYGKDMMNELETKMGITSATYSIYQVGEMVHLPSVLHVSIHLTFKW